MTTYAATYHTKSARETKAWFSVETPGVFREFKLTIADEDMTATERRQYVQLQRLAEKHGTTVRMSTYRRG